MSSDSATHKRPPLSGYNHNIRYNDRVFHVQTEDSGLERPHVFTHLFLEGMIVATLRSDYKDLATKAGHEKRVCRMMQEQHKTIMKQLRRGELDAQITLMSQAPVDVSGVSQQERANIDRGQRVSQETAALLRQSGEMPAVVPEFGAIPFIEIGQEDDEESLELDLEVISAIDLDEPEQNTPERTLIGQGPPSGFGEELDLDEEEEWGEPTPVIWDRDIKDMLEVRITRSKPGPGKKRRTPSRPPAQRKRTPSLPVAPRRTVRKDEAVTDEQGLFWEPEQKPKQKK